MFLITKKSDDTVIMWGARLDYLDNGYPRLVDENVAFIPEEVNIYDNIIIEDGIEEHKYSYTKDKGFYITTGWLSPEELEMIFSPAYQAGYDQAVLDLMEV